MISGPLNQLAQRSLADCYRWFPDTVDRSLDWKVIHFSLGICGERGEVIEIIKKWQGERKGYDLTDPAIRARLAEEMCDVLMYIGDLAAVLGLDLDEAMELKRLANDERFR